MDRILLSAAQRLHSAAVVRSMAPGTAAEAGAMRLQRVDYSAFPGACQFK